MADEDNKLLDPNILIPCIGIGRLGKNDKNEWDSDRHLLLFFQCHPAIEKNIEKNFKNHLKAIMDRGANRLSKGKRIKLTSDHHDYHVHISVDYAKESEADEEGEDNDNDDNNNDNDDDDNNNNKGKKSNNNNKKKESIPLEERSTYGSNPLICFFLITHPDINKYHSVSTLIKDIKKLTFNNCTAKQLSLGKGGKGGIIQIQLNKLISSIIEKYSNNIINTVTDKVEGVRTIMQDNVKKAIGNVEQLEAIEEKSVVFEDQARQFSKNSNKLKNLFRCRYYKLIFLMGLLAVAILAYIAYAIYEKVH